MSQHHKKLTNEDLVKKSNLQDIINDGRFRVAIFGSARIKPEDGLYKAVSGLSKNLAMRGYDIITGGGPGVMEAASVGHHIACESPDHPHSIGINIELPFEQKPNKYLDITESATTFGARLDTFMLLSHLFVIAPGGVGTMLELFYTWQLMQVGHICRSPIILWGNDYAMFREFIQRAMVDRGFASASDAEMVIQAENADQVLKLIDEAYHAHEQLGDNACVNIKQYLAGARRLGLID